MEFLMRRLSLTSIAVLTLILVVPYQAFGPPTMQAAQAPAQQPAQAADAAPPAPTQIPLDLFKVPEGFEVTLWAATPMLNNPTNLDIDRAEPLRIAEGVRYRQHWARQPEGDPIIVLQ